MGSTRSRQGSLSSETTGYGPSFDQADWVRLAKARRRSPDACCAKTSLAGLQGPAACAELAPLEQL
jgi:hypothetical protein